MPTEPFLAITIISRGTVCIKPHSMKGSEPFVFGQKFGLFWCGGQENERNDSPDDGYHALDEENPWPTCKISIILQFPLSHATKLTIISSIFDLC
jgi:hypothetical protein